MEELLAHPQFRAYSVEDVERVVATNDKQRFKLHPHPEDGRLQIRASQGHSIQVNGVEKPQMVQSRGIINFECNRHARMLNFPSK